MTAPLKSLIVQAGPRALKHLREHGLRPQDIDVVPGAAGVPRGWDWRGSTSISLPTGCLPGLPNAPDRSI